MSHLPQAMAQFDAVPAIHQLDREWCARLLRPVLDWCAADLIQRARPDQIASAQRSAELESAAHTVLPDSCHTEWSSDVALAFNAFLNTRNEKLREASVDDHFVHEELSRPQSLLVTDWRASLFDAALTPETDGFLNSDGLPPWDTWFGLVACPEAEVGPACLLSWVPRWISDRIDAAIAIDAAECLSWGRFNMSGRLSVVGWGAKWND